MADQPHQANDDAAHKKHVEETKKRLADEKTAREKERAEQRDAMSGVKPTPTQEENDLAASGVHVAEKEPDGSAPDTGMLPPATTAAEREKRQSEASKTTPQRGSYPTRATTANPTTT
jgi:hypothetical protein